MKILFVINPRAGTCRDKSHLIHHVKNRFSSHELIFRWTQTGEDASHFTQWGIKEKVDVVVSAGGDGTMNKIGTALLGSEIPMLILPMGSGNGLLRHLKIPLNIFDALELLEKGKPMSTDAGMINNEHYFFCTAGVGFDAEVAHHFSKSEKRGSWNYYRIVAKNILSCPLRNYQIFHQKKTANVSATMVTFANASQYGNNILIAPHAKTDDGMLDCCTVYCPTQMTRIITALKLFQSGLEGNSAYQSFPFREIEIQSEIPVRIHADGDVLPKATSFKISVKPKALKVLV